MRRLRLVLCVTAVALLALPASAMAGRLWATGHDADLHCVDGDNGQCHYLQRALAYVQATAPDPSKPVLALDNTHNQLDQALTASGIPHVTISPTDPKFATLALTTSSYSAIAVASDATCSGCDLNQASEGSDPNATPDSDAINARTGDIQAFFNAGGGILALAGACHGGSNTNCDRISTNNDYYNFMPLPVGGAAVTQPFCLTPVGVFLGLFDNTSACPNKNGTSSDINGPQTHNSFSLPAPGSVIQVAETDSKGLAETLVAEGTVSGGTIKHSTASGVGCSPNPFTGSTTCTALVGDTSGAPTTPTGTVTFSTDSGSFSNGGTCTLGANGACSVTYTGPGGSHNHTITESYSGDGTHAPSSNNTLVSEQLVAGGPPPPPVLGKSADVFVKSGTVRIKLPGSNTFVTLTAGQSIPYGSTIDTTHGTVTMVNAKPGGGTQSGDFNGGQFVIAQDKTGLVTLSLTGGGIVPATAASVGTRVEAARSSRHAWGNAHGRYRTRGRWASATVRGTHWEVIDSCSGTTVIVLRGTVVVRDQVRHKTIKVKAHHRYFAKAPRGARCTVKKHHKGG